MALLNVDDKPMMSIVLDRCAVQQESSRQRRKERRKRANGKGIDPTQGKTSTERREREERREKHYRPFSAIIHYHSPETKTRSIAATE
jgi:hypothetical protein